MIVNNNIDNGKAFDWGLTSKDYAKYRDIYPELFYQRILDLGLCTKGQNVLDLGTGTGVLPRNMYKFGANFIGADISENQIEQAIILSKEKDMNIEYVVASAETVDFPDGTFDVVTACQCFVYFDKPIALPKIHKMLKKDGHFCILFMAWLPAENEIAQNSEDLVLKYNPSWTGANCNRFKLEIPECTEGLFEIEDAITYDLNVPFTRDTWHGRMIACRGIGASSLSKEEIAKFEIEHKAYLETVPETFEIVHYTTVLNLRKI